MFSSFVSFSQTINLLDKKNGLSSFKFGTTPAFYHNKIQRSKSLSGKGNGEVYMVTDSTQTSFFGYKTEFVELIFLKNKLYCIFIAFYDGERININDKYNSIVYKLEKLFGNSELDINKFSESKESITLEGKRWDAIHNQLDIYKTYVNNRKIYEISIWYYSKDIEKEGLDSEF